MDKEFQLHSPFQPGGDQPTAIEKLLDGLDAGLAHQTLLGVTGSGKTFTMANVIAKAGRPTMILAPNKTLAAQLYGEMREFSQKTPWNTLFLIMIITNLKLMYRRRTPSSKKTPRLTSMLSKCVCLQRRL